MRSMSSLSLPNWRRSKLRRSRERFPDEKIIQGDELTEILQLASQKALLNK